MKAIRTVDKQMQQRIRASVKEEFERQSNEMTRRLFKMACVTLHQEYGFGKDRLNRFIDALEKIATEREQDEVFWAHVDRYCKVLGLEFANEDYERMDG